MRKITKTKYKIRFKENYKQICRFFWKWPKDKDSFIVNSRKMALFHVAHKLFYKEILLNEFIDWTREVVILLVDDVNVVVVVSLKIELIYTNNQNVLIGKKSFKIILK